MLLIIGKRLSDLFSTGVAINDQTGEKIDFVKQIFVNGEIHCVKYKEKENLE